MANDRGTRRAGIGLAILLALALFCAGQSAALAAEQSAVAALPFKQEFATDATGVNEAFTYVLAARDLSNPMPEGASGGKYRWTMRGNTEFTLQIAATEAGVYTYSVSQEISSPVKGYHYDRRNYEVMLSVSQTSDGQGLTARAFVKNAQGEKVDALLFQNSYAQNPSPTPEATQPPSGGGSVRTGDDNHLIVYLLLMLASAAGVVFLLVYLWKHKGGSQGDEHNA